MSDKEEKKATPAEADAPKTDAKPAAEVKADAKPEAKAEAKPEAQAEAKTEAKTEAKPEAKAEGDAPAEKPKTEAAAGGRGGRGGDRGGRGGGGGGRGGDRGGRRGRSGDRESTDGLYEKVVKINRTAKVVKGGRRFSFSVLGVVGDQQGRVGVGMGKANGVPAAIKKALEKARANMISVPLDRGRTIPYQVESKYSGCRMVMRPATPGTGIIAGGPARAILEALGVQDILTKKIGSSNPGNVLNATLSCLSQLRAAHDVAKLRGIPIHNLFHGHDAPEPEPKPEAAAEAPPPADAPAEEAAASAGGEA